MIGPMPTLPEAERRLHRALLNDLLLTGELPSAHQVAESAGISRLEIRSLMEALDEADYLSHDVDGRLVCLYPLSPTPTPHIVAFDGIQRFAMCSIDALGMAAMLDRDVTITSVCPVCGAAVSLDVSPVQITRVDPAETLVVARRDADRPACEACCPHTFFVCSFNHAEVYAAHLPEITVLSLAEALTSGETIFGGMLADQLPVHRPRMRDFASDRG